MLYLSQARPEALRRLLQRRTGIAAATVPGLTHKHQLPGQRDRAGQLHAWLG